jgi:hypothetical protein
MYSSASPQILRESASDLNEISKELLDISHILNDKEELCEGCGLNVRENFQQYLWKKTIVQTSKRLEQVAREMNKT